MLHHHDVSREDLDGAASPQEVYWIAIAARVFPLLATASKAKRERKAGRLMLNGDPRTATNAVARLGDHITLIDNQSVLVNERTVHKENDPKRDPRRWMHVCERQGLRIVFEGDEFAVIVKPVGVHVNGRGWRTVEHALSALLRPAPTQIVDALSSPHALHRLDSRVGGVLLVAKTRTYEVLLAKQFESHRVVKRYRAILAGRLNLAQASLLTASMPTEAAASLTATGHDINRQVACIHDQVDGKAATTAVAVCMATPSARYGWITTVDLWPITGRKHQLRAHMAKMGHPIIGDDLYHDHSHAQDVVRGQGIYLHAVAIAFDDLHGNRRSFTVEEPHKFSRFRHFCALNRQRQIDREGRSQQDQVVEAE